MTAASKYRQASVKVINLTLARFPQLGVADIRKVLCREYPFRSRSGWAYTCWLLEVRLALVALAKLKGEPPPPRLGRLSLSRARRRQDLPGQLTLWGGDA